MSFLCNIGLHDWEEIDRKTDIHKNCGRYYNCKMNDASDKPPTKRVCLRCGKCIDEEKTFIKKYEEQERKRVKEELINGKRKRLAEKMFENCDGK